MLQEKHSVNNFEISRNERENGGNRLTAYFEDSGFLAQQQELGLFIKNLPIIRIEEVKSINKLIELLIRQNQILGSKCQQNILTVKEMYGKHEDLLRTNRQLQGQVQEVNKHLEYNNVNQKQIDQCLERLGKSRQQLKEREEKTERVEKELEESRLQNQYYHDSLEQLVEIFKLITERNVKRSSEKIKQMVGKSAGKNTLSWIDWSQLQRFVKEEKKKLKYYPKIRETIELFCNRFIKISEYVPASLIKEECNRQVANLLELIDDLLMLKKRSSLMSSQSRASDFSVMAEGNFFEGVLGRMMKEQESNSVTKVEITNELLQVKRELGESKKYYEQYLIRNKLQYQERIRRAEEGLAQKRHVLQFYESEKEKAAKDQLQMKGKLGELQQGLKAERYLHQQKGEGLAVCQAKLQSLKSQSTIRENEIREQWDENIKTYEYKLKQKHELLQEQQQQRKNMRVQLEDKIAHLKTLASKLQEDNQKLSMCLKELSAQKQQQRQQSAKSLSKLQQQRANLQNSLGVKSAHLQQLSRRLQRQSLELKRLKDQLSENECEKNLQAAYIKELQSKNAGLQTRIQAATAKKTEDKTAKKELTTIKQTMVEQKKYAREMEQSYQGQRQQNQRLKAVIKSMKKELEEVYLQFNQLKTIENDREKLLVEIEKSDRAKEEFYRQYETMKLGSMKLEQQNKALQLELKHYRNALSRIEALR